MGSARTELSVGLLASFVAAVDGVRWIRPALLLDSDPSWAAERVVLWLLVAGATLLAGVAAAGAFGLWSRIPAVSEPLRPILLSSGTRAGLMAAAVVIGAVLRFAALDRMPEPMWVDDLSLIRPTLALRGSGSDFANATRDAPYGVARPYGSVGVLYLEAYRASLRLWGTTVFGVRFPSALAGAASVLTGALLGRALLPAGGGMLAALILAGLRYHLILSRWSWVMIALAPIVDLATLLVLAARRRHRPGLALAAGLLAGAGAHVYLSAWTAGLALTLFALWPADPSSEVGRDPEGRGASRSRALRAAAFVAGFSLAVAPIFLLREGRRVSYFARTRDHNVALEVARTKSWMPPFAAAADTFAAPWLLPDPSPRNDLAGRRRLDVMLGAAVAVAFGRALVRPRDRFSGLLLTHAVAVLAAAVAGGQADHPNGSRFAYLSSIAAVSAAAGVLWVVGLVPPARRRAAAVAAVGVLAIGGALGARDALVRWADASETFDGFHGQDTRIGRAAARWEEHGAVEIAPEIGHSPLAIEAVRRYRLDPDPRAPVRPREGVRIRIVAPATPTGNGERVVERISDARGTLWAVVLASRPKA